MRLRWTTRRSMIGSAALVAAVTLVAACSSGTSPTAGPSVANTLSGKATPAAHFTTDTDDQYAQLVAAAKAEGEVVVSGPRGLPEFQKVIADGFTAKYGIKVVYSGLGGSKVLKKMLATQPGKPYPYDVLVGGYDTLFANLDPENALTELDSQIVLKEDTDLSKWAGGQIPWDNSGHTSLGFLNQSGQYFYVDTSKAKLSDIKSYRDLLKPQWRNQILLADDPRTDGTVNAVIALFLQSKGLGQNFVRQFLTTQKPTIGESEEEVDKDIKSPSFLMCVCNNSQGTELIKEHPNFAKLDPHKVAEGTTTTSSFANVAVPARVQHPNAAKLYLNWLLSEQTGLAAAKATGLPSARVDVPRDFLAAQSIPDPSWPNGANESALTAKDQAQLLALEILGPLPAGPSS